MLAWRRPYLVWVHAEPAEARRGQRARGRVLRRSCFERHARLGAAFVARLRAGHQPRGWHRVILLDRRRARYGLVLDTEPAEGSVGQRSGELPAGSTGQPPRELPVRPGAGEVDAPAERAAG
jgi:hypothetical protein